MTVLIEILMTNAAALTLLAVLAWVVTRRLRRPAWRYAIWLSVLLRAVAPPLWELPIVPAMQSGQVEAVQPSSVDSPAPDATGSPVARAAAPAQLVGPAPPASRTESWTLWDLIFGVWLAGSLLFLVLAAIRAGRFERLLAAGSEADEEAQRMGEEVAARLGARCPPVRLVQGRLSPLLWHRPGRLWLVIPRLLWTSLTRHERRLLLAHELSHVKRKDHWVRLVELIAAAGYWWHPVLHWSRSQLRQAEERCCDEEVIRHFPGGRSSYARSLCKAADFLADGRIREPQFVCGAGTIQLEERIRDIMSKDSSMSFPMWQKLVLIIVCSWGLLLFPTRAVGAAQGGLTAEQDQYLSSLNSKTAELRKQMRELRARQHELEVEGLRLRHQAEIQRLDSEIAKQASSGRAEMADWLRKQRELAANRMELEVQRLQFEGELQLAMVESESRLQRLQLEMETAAASEQVERIPALEQEISRAKAERSDLELKWQQRQTSLQRSALELEELEQRLRAERLRMEGHHEQAEALEAEIGLRRQMRELEFEQQQTQHRLHRLEALQAEIHSVARQAAELRRQGQTEAAERLERHLDELKRKLDQE